MEITLEITNYCPHGCDYCSSNGNKEDHKSFALSYDDVARYLSIKDNIAKSTGGITRINISGGEPLAHPEFYKILTTCEMYCDDVRVYTNAIKHIFYNTDIIKELKVDANVCLKPGRNVYIPEGANTVHLLQLVPQGRAKNMKPVNFHVSGNIAGNDGCDLNACANCENTVLQADGREVPAPCKKSYKEK